ncbi:MAG: HAD-IIA family hydrolase [Anaerolineaceae bacterium]|jgi:NagD protein|nr:HAD-IIA family hydrolase [Anaerolineaceae bacterium]
MTESKVKNYICDMDGVLISGDKLVPGADAFIERLEKAGAKFLVLTNNPIHTPRDLSHRLTSLGLTIGEEKIFTSSIATARFLRRQRPNGTAFVIGESGLTTALHEEGYIITNTDPDYVVLGEANTYSLDMITKAVRLISAGARFIATNPDASGPGVGGLVPACGAVAAMIEKATGISPLFIGKPNPLMMRTALNYLGAHSENSIMIGDNMDTDIITGVQSGMETILVLSGITKREDVAKYPFVPTHIVDSVADIYPVSSSSKKKPA